MPAINEKLNPRSHAAAGNGQLGDSLRHARLHMDLPVPKLVEMALQRGEGVLADNGALCVQTGTRTGRSPNDRYIVDDPVVHTDVDWGKVNHPYDPAAFEALWTRACTWLHGRELFTARLQAGTHARHALPLFVITEYAWHNLFAHQLFVRPNPAAAEPAGPEWTILNLPSLETEPERDGTHSDGAVILDFAGRRILLLGMRYAGEMKKAVFSALNYLAPPHDVLPMHCAANVGEGGDVALFFGLSGTGKTTLSADPMRFLIGDDEHGWDDEGIFNFEGGCYAKCINLNPEREPVIWDAIRFGAAMENVVLAGDSHAPVFEDASITENTRVAYPREFVSMRMPGNQGGQPNAVIFLTCDLYGVLPPVALLSREQAAYHFLSGYTALVGSTEVGQAEGIKPTFSACFGAPFFPRRASVYAELLMDKIVRHGAPVYLVNTGWTGGPYGEGQRFSIATTRAIVHAVLRGDVEKAKTRILPGFNVRIPLSVHGVDACILDPRETWSDKAAYDRNARELIGLFRDNFARFDVTDEIAAAGPRM
ncbi:MAG: phosphoenolpyruvate carboxykinase (ATP) [Gammaproteobacteria bacterium]